MVARKYDLTLEELLRFNQMKPQDPFRIGDKLTIPFPGEALGEKYTVKAGDSIARIADYHGISQKDLLTANGLRKGQSLKVGAQLSIPEGLRGGAFKSHIVKKGDTLANLAKTYRL